MSGPQGHRCVFLTTLWGAIQDSERARVLVKIRRYLGVGPGHRAGSTKFSRTATSLSKPMLTIMICHCCPEVELLELQEGETSCSSKSFLSSLMLRIWEGQHLVSTLEKWQGLTGLNNRTMRQTECDFFAPTAGKTPKLGSLTWTNRIRTSSKEFFPAEDQLGRLCVDGR